MIHHYQPVLNLVSDRESRFTEGGDYIFSMPPVPDKRLRQEATFPDKCRIQAYPTVVHGKVGRKWQYVL